MFGVKSDSDHCLGAGIVSDEPGVMERGRTTHTNTEILPLTALAETDGKRTESLSVTCSGVWDDLITATMKVVN